MSESVKKRRRWPWAILVAVLLLFSGPVAWSFRPLNATERALIGTWRLNAYNGTSSSHRRCFRADRTFEEIVCSNGQTSTTTGSWTASPESIRVFNLRNGGDSRPPPPAHWRQRLHTAVFGVEIPAVRVEGANRLYTGNWAWDRVGE